MPIAATFVQDQGIYGKKERTGWRPTASSPFIVFKDESGWALGHMRSGLAVMAMVPHTCPKTKKGLLEFAEAMERAIPDVVAMISLIDSREWPEDVKPYGVQMIDWARGYRP